MTTKNKAHRVASYQFSEGENILIDANVWLFIHAPAGGPGSGWSNDYELAYKRLLAARARPVTDALVLSEYLNRYFRLEYDGGWKQYYQTFKKFRQSRDFANLAQDAVGEVREILKKATIQDTASSVLSISDILAATEAGAMDFNDAILVDSCRHNGWKFLTNDEDCSVGGIEVITALPALIRACS